MTTFRFNELPAARHEVSIRGGTAHVDGRLVALRIDDKSTSVAVVDGRSERLVVAAHGDSVFVQLKGRSWRLDVVDATRAAGGPALAAAQGAAGASLAPMPGVVVSMASEVGHTVRRGDALLVIESMKLQMTISAEADGEVVELPFAIGQTFQRGVLLARISFAGVAA